MIQYCTCSGGSSSTSEQSRNRVAVSTCKICGGKVIVDSSRSLPSSMLSTVGLELTSVINSDLSWKTVSKGNRSATRRARRPISRGLKGSGDLNNKDLKRVDMPVSESEKHGVTILGRRFSDKVEHVPIKKRRFSLRSPSPPPRMPSPCLDEPGCCIKSHTASGHQQSSSNSISKGQVMSIDTVVDNELGQVFSDEITVDGKKLEEICEKLDDNEDFSGISILAAAACNNFMEAGAGNTEEGSGDEESFEVLVNPESCSLAKESFNEHSLSCAEVSNNGIASPQNMAAVVNDILDGKNMGCPSLNYSGVVSQSSPSSKDDETQGMLESSSRDDRSHWDLNVVMDAWENPCEDANMNSQTSAFSSKSGDHLHCEGVDNLEISKVQREPGDTKYSMEKIVKPTISGVVSVDVQEDISRLPDIRSLVAGNVKSNVNEHKLGACTAPREAFTFQESDPSSEIDNAPNNAMVLSKETKPVHNQEGISSNVGAVPSGTVEYTLEPSTLANICAVPDEVTSTHCVIANTRENGETLSSHQVLSENACIDHSCPEEHHIPIKPLPEECNNKAFPFNIGEQMGDGCVADAQFGELMCLRSPEVEKHTVSLPCAVDPKKACCDDDDVDRESNFLADGYASEKVLSMDNITCQALQPGHLEDALDKSEKVGASQMSLDHEELSTSGGSIGKSECVVAADMKVQDGNISNAEDELLNTIEPDKCTQTSSIQTLGVADTPEAMGGLSSLEACKSYGDDPADSSGKVPLLEDTFEDSDYDSGDSQSGHGHFFEVEKENEHQVDYDSQYEDGELRESVVRSWEEDVGDEGDAEHVDYGSDNRDMYGIDAADYPLSISVQVEGASCRKERSAEVEHVDYEEDQVEESNMQEAKCQAFLGGSSKANDEEAQSEKRREVKALNAHSRGYFGSVDGISKFKMDLEVDQKLNEGAEDVGNRDFCARGGAAKESIQSESSRMKFSGWDQLPEGSRSSVDKIMDVGDGSDRKNHTASHMDGLNSRDSLTGVSCRELPSCMEGPTFSNALLRKNNTCLQGTRSNNFDDSNPRFRRDTGSVKSIGRGGSLHLHGREQGGDCWVESPGRHLGPNHHHSPSYHGPVGFVHPGPTNAAAAAAAKVESSGFVVAPDGTIVKAGSVGPTGRVHRHSVRGSSQGVHRSLTRRVSPADRDEAFDLHIGLGQVGERSPERSISVYRGRSGRYGPRFGMGPRERYHRGVPDDSIGLSMRPPLVRSEQSFSPIQRQGAPHPSQSRTRSRSRSRSPLMWPSPRGRNGYVPVLRQSSRSPPNSRSEARMDRVRSPHRRPNFRADHMVGFDSAPGSHVSPSYTYRWIDNRKDAANHFREQGYKHRSSVSERSSPGRPLQRNHRIELMDSPIRLRPDEYYRPMYPRKFPEMIRDDRGPKCHESDDDKRKHSDRYGMVRAVRRYDTDGTVKRFQYDVEDGFTAHNSHNKDTRRFHGRGSTKEFIRGIDRRLGDGPRRAREDKSHFRYDREGKYNANFKPFGIRDYDEDIAPRRRRPS